jgi:hypothetical protein|tara:strand:+ start:965 stop:1594 length:630 start_codon:yes stop_codon:yes gene_type:complete
MHDQDLTNTQALIDRYYTEEKARKAQALTHASLNLQLDANDLAMLSTIAKRFGKSRTDLAKDVLSHALIDLLTQLEPSERKLIARDADEMGSSMAREIAEENGLKEIDHKPNVWTAHDRSITKAEKKRAKELEDAAKAEKQAQKSANFTEEVNTSLDEIEENNEDSVTAEANVESTTPEETKTEGTETDLASDSNEYANQEDSTASTFA